jgi:hypothetical protein
MVICMEVQIFMLFARSRRALRTNFESGEAPPAPSDNPRRLAVSCDAPICPPALEAGVGSGRFRNQAAGPGPLSGGTSGGVR